MQVKMVLLLRVTTFIGVKNIPIITRIRGKRHWSLNQKSVGVKALTTHKFDQESCRRMLARMGIKNKLPFEFVKKEGFSGFWSSYVVTI